MNICIWPFWHLSFSHLLFSPLVFFSFSSFLILFPSYLFNLDLFSLFPPFQDSSHNRGMECLSTLMMLEAPGGFGDGRRRPASHGTQKPCPVCLYLYYVSAGFCSGVATRTISNATCMPEARYSSPPDQNLPTGTLEQAAFPLTSGV